ncbi:transporter substrate-binding domain-containing protein [Alteromonas sp. ASW11-36]|uniref:Transporter substrate-binding domain-containing protein n=1 Tax=Alteromonas arenosi TaxID=3055817 RepID=A0ABT7SX48_9ALTE|nr:transporter substrate-binding domain-containing protein [Alteromonas sp. ASW11-36]MDM7860766.1 transporter substrate-binding domain-containing protein [Alteromonas sp. ASW11-36]
MLRLLILLFLAGCWLSLNSATGQEAKTLTLVVNSPGTPPHLYFNQTENKYDGVIPDLLRYAERNSHLTIEYVDSHRNRNEKFVSSGKFDMFYSSIAWVSQPADFISTIPIFSHESFLYAIVPFPADFSLDLNTTGKVCTRRGFKYPALEPLFADGNLIRIDSSSHDTMLKMLILGRCDMVEMNLKNASALIYAEEYKSTEFYRSSLPTSSVPAALIMHPNRAAERDIFNRFIERFHAEGLYAESLAKHLHP